MSVPVEREWALSRQHLTRGVATASATSAAVMAYISNGTSCSISVSTGPGVTMLTLMPSRSTSSAKARAKAFMPAFDAE